ncbi:hypothetical protein [Cupriavidus numazuensis]
MVDDFSLSTGPTAYSVIPLNLGKPVSAVLPDGINGSGQVAGFGTTSRGAVHAFTYANSSLQDLGTLGGANSAAQAINAAGKVVKVSHASRGHCMPSCGRPAEGCSTLAPWVGRTPMRLQSALTAM